jgi:hypothetical protein
VFLFFSVKKNNAFCPNASMYKMPAMLYFCICMEKVTFLFKYCTVLFLVVSLQACVTTQKSTSTNQKESADSGPTDTLEDYAHLWIPEAEKEINGTGVPTDLTVNKAVLARIDAQAKQHSAVKYINGYRIQLYVGRDKALANEAKLHVYQHVPNTNPYLSYNLPMYKVQMGDYTTKASAEHALGQVKNSFPDAIIVSEKIDISKHFNKN